MRPGSRLEQMAAQLSSRRSRPAWAVLVSIGLGLGVADARAQDFQVFCTNNADGTVSCSGWQGGETLTCVVSSGGTSSCTTPSGRGFVCVREPGGVSSCRPNGQSALERPAGGGTECTFTGDGNFVCVPPPRRSPELLPRPGLGGVDPFDQLPRFDVDVPSNLITPLTP